MANQKDDIVRPIANFSPSLWGDHFIKYTIDTKMAEANSVATKVLANEFRTMLIDPRSTMVDTMSFIDTLERLGVAYRYEEEIESKLEEFFKLDIDYEDEAYDLSTVSLHFRLFRQHGHRISSDIFRKFRDDQGRFLEALKSDVKGLLSLYEAAHLRTQGEDILDDAMAFATTNLKAMVPNLGSPLREQVVHALVQALHFGVPRIEVRNFISMYEMEVSKNESLLRFAKLDYNLLQILHNEELREISRWWKELDFATKLPHIRDRVVECFFWAIGVYYEPQYSRARIMLAKTIAMTSVIDDTYDAYGTVGELDILTEAIERWDINQIDLLPGYLQPLYKALLELYDQFEDELAKEGRSYTIGYAKDEFKDMVRSYNVEAKWFIKGYLPPFSEYLKNALITSTYSYHTVTSLLGMKLTTKDDFEWLSKKPKPLLAGLIVCRAIGDVATYEIEKERGQISTGIDSYMKENGVTKEEAMYVYLEMATNAWKDINEGFLISPSPCSRDVLMRILNLSRNMDVAYKNREDGYTEPEKVLKPYIIALFVDPINI
uniref:Terpene synthase 3 n=1 Tax=Leucophyllum frutescens TaxID=86643 RepID=A0A7G6J4L8_LEUFR|nr:terpene synthase 3 [Leucophyllum frutescens]